MIKVAVFSKIKNVISNLSNKEVPLISIIIPVHNANKEDIKKAFKSITNQSLNFNDIEVIFVNNKSHKTAGITIIKGYAKKYSNVKLYNAKINDFASAYNYGLKEATGTYVMFLNPDEYLTKEACNLLYNVIESEFVDIVSGNYVDLNKSEDKTNWNTYNINHYKTKVENIVQKIDLLSVPSDLCAKIYRKSFLDENKITFDDYLFNINKFFNSKTLLKAKGIIFINEIVFKKDKNVNFDSTDSTNDFDYLRNSMVINNDCYNLIREKFPEDTYVILNDANNIIDYLLNTDLTREQLKEFVDKTKYFFNDFIHNDKTDINDNYLKICRYISKGDYQNTYYKYRDYRNEQTIYNKQKSIIKPKKDSYENTNENIDVSVIVPIYNGEKFLDSCLNSIHDQSLTNIEIICIDDNSTDDTFKILKQHQKIDKRIRILHSKIKRGLTASKNTGIKYAKGEYFTFVDCDDWIDANCLKEAYMISQENNLDLYMFNHETYTEKEAKIENNDIETVDYLKNYDNTLINASYDINLAKVFKKYSNTTGKLYLTSFIRNNNIKFNSKRKLNDDNFTIISFLKAKKVMLTTKSFYNKRIHDKSTSSNDLALLDIIFMLRDDFIIINHVTSLYNKYKKDYFNYMIKKLKENFYKISSEYKVTYFNHMKQFVEKAILKYDLDSDIRSSLTKDNLIFYDYIISSVDSNNDKIISIKESINLKKHVSIVIYSKNLLKKEIDEIIHNLLNQSIDFSMLDLIFIDNKSMLNTNKYIDNILAVYPNVKHLILEDEYDESRVYEIALNDVDTNYVMFLNPRYEYTTNAIKHMLKVLHENNLNIVSGYIENSENSKENTLIWTKMFRTKFIDEFNPDFLEEQDYNINVCDKIYKQKGIVNIDVAVLKS